MQGPNFQLDSVVRCFELSDVAALENRPNLFFRNCNEQAHATRAVNEEAHVQVDAVTMIQRHGTTYKTSIRTQKQIADSHISGELSNNAELVWQQAKLVQDIADTLIQVGTFA
jgi:hypothetical protein